MTVRDLIIVGSGPAGLATAIAAQKAGLDYVVLEKGVLVNALFNFPTNMVYFTTPELLEIGGLPFVTPYEKPTRMESLRYYRRVVDTYKLNIELGEEVMTILPGDLTAPGRGLAVETRSQRGVRRAHHTKSVVLATGSYDHPNMLGVPGEDLPHVSHYFKDPHPYYRKRVVVVGGKNSAAETSLELYRAGASVTLVHRGSALNDSIKYWVKPDIENRIKEGAIEARFDTHVVEIRPTTVLVERQDVREEIPADGVFLHTGYHGDTTLFEHAGIAFDAETCVPEYDAETLETNVPNLYLAGSVVAGRRGGLIFIENGRFHGESVVAVIKKRFMEMSLHADG